MEDKRRWWLWGASGVLTIALAVGLALCFRPSRGGRITADRALQVVEERLMHGLGEAVGDGNHVLTIAERQSVVSWLYQHWPSRDPCQSYDSSQNTGPVDSSWWPAPEVCIDYYPAKVDRDPLKLTIQILQMGDSVTVDLKDVNAKKDWCKVVIKAAPKTGEWFAAR